MCGINGILSKKLLYRLMDRISKMNGAIMHRGPDARSAAEIIRDKGAFGHRRLSVIDLNERSNQPMRAEDGRCMITYNGEIYNYRQLKTDLHYHFKTESDTETILAGLSHEGISFVKRCNGMFAFAFWNQDKNELVLCRDRLGIKPLFYYYDGGKVIFSSEIKGILNSGLVEAPFNDDAADDYLGHRYVREPHTSFKNIYQVEAGTFCRFGIDLKRTVCRYWDVPQDFNMSHEYSASEIREQFRERLAEAVKKRMISDVPLGTYLSGGVDSSILSAIVAKNMGERIHTYTIGFEEMYEFAYARMVSEKYNTIHHEIMINGSEYLDKLDEVISYKDAPLGVPNEILLAVMSKKLKEKITVVLSGEGADELLDGYGRIFRSPFDYKNHSYNIDFYDFFINKYEYVPRRIRDKFLRRGSMIRDNCDLEIRRRFADYENEYNVFWFFHKYHVQGLLNRVDATTMLAALEARVPFLDHELVEFAYSEIPYDMKLRWKSESCKCKAKMTCASEYSERIDIPKAILREISYGFLPPEVIERRKVGFPVPLAAWEKRLREMARQELPGAEWLKEDFDIDEFLEECLLLSNGAQVIWMFINMQLFYKQYFCREWRY